jgi:hypothetical protein
MMLRKKKLARVHFKDAEVSVEGVLVGVTRTHYHLAAAKHIDGTDRSRAIDGATWIPRENVLYLQVIG